MWLNVGIGSISARRYWVVFSLGKDGFYCRDVVVLLLDKALGVVNSVYCGVNTAVVVVNMTAAVVNRRVTTYHVLTAARRNTAGMLAGRLFGMLRRITIS